MILEVHLSNLFLSLHRNDAQNASIQITKSQNLQSLTINSTNYLFLSEISSAFLLLFNDQDNFIPISTIYICFVSKTFETSKPQAREVRKKKEVEPTETLTWCNLLITISWKLLLCRDEKNKILKYYRLKRDKLLKQMCHRRGWFIIIFITQKKNAHEWWFSPIWRERKKCPRNQTRAQ